MVILTELPQESSSSSSSTHDHTYRYGVFLSFRGADTRNGFTDHLYNTLLDAGINTFLDDAEIDTGEPLKPELESAIKSSRASVIVLSKNYASSTWCLDELVLILDQKMKFNQIVIPIFYHVEPTDVRKQQNSFGEAMEKHKRRMDAETNAEKKSEWAQKMELWKRALSKVADLKGKDANDRKETEIIKDVITDIHHRLGVLVSSTLPSLVGMDNHIEFISSWLTDGCCHTADILTIVGMSGIGKTCFARHVFGLHAGKFERSSFVEAIATGNQRLLDLQKQLHEDISKKTPLQVNDVSVYTSKIENTLARKMVFVVLDDIDSVDQLNALLGNKGLHPGSKIIITTKDASVIEQCALFNPQVQPKHKKVSLTGLSETKSLELLCINAFKSQQLKQGYYEVSHKLVKYCDGHPLALEVLGRSLYKRDVAYWEECIKVLKKEPHSHINTTLKMSFDTLLFENDKELFKHIACFFVGTDRDVTETILNACDINTRSGITNLVDRCLLSISSTNKLMMHQLVQEMGRDLVRQESPNKPWERSRLCCHEESFNVLKQEKGSENLLGLVLDLSVVDKEKLNSSLQLKTNSLSKMDNLKLLQLNYVKITGSYKNISKELRWLCLHGFHFKSIPSELPMENLVVLDMSHSNIESFDMSYSSSQRFVSRLKELTASSSKEKRLLGSLKILDLSFCNQLRRLGGFFKLPALERLIAQSCIRLIEVCESVEQCVKLVHIDLSHCCRLKKLPTSIGKLKVETLLLDGCNFRESQINMCVIDIYSQTSSSAVMKAIPSDKKFLTISLPSSLRRLSLANNNLHNESFPRDFSCLAMLEELCLDDNPISSMPSCVRNLHRLKKLSMDYCDKVVSIEHPPCTLKVLSFACLNTSLRIIKFHPEMSPLDISCAWSLSSPWSFEVDGIIKIQPLADVDEKVLYSLGWTNLEFIKERRMEVNTSREGSQESQIQMYYEFGIFSIFFEWHNLPDWIMCRRKGPSISFTIPSSPKKLRGLNLCYVVETRLDKYFTSPTIFITNITKDDMWCYYHYVDSIRPDGYYINVLSHWMFGPNEMKDGDKIFIRIVQNEDDINNQRIWECGISFVYDDDGKIEEEKEDMLGYYKSWNHIIGGDLSSFQLTTGAYLLYNGEFTRIRSKAHGRYQPLFQAGPKTRSRVENFMTHRKYAGASPWSSEIYGMVRIQPLEDVKENVLFSMGWKNLEFIKKRFIRVLPCFDDSQGFQTQMYYESGIFSTFYEGKEMPKWINCRRKGSSISFTIPSSPNSLRGLNLCGVVMGISYIFWLPMIKITNITKNHTWIYVNYIDRVMLVGQDSFEDGEENYEDGEEKSVEGEEKSEDGEEKSVESEEKSVDGEEHSEDFDPFRYYHFCWLSHWMFGPNEMKAGDHITIIVANRFSSQDQEDIIDCGIGLVYDEDEDGKNEEEEEDIIECGIGLVYDSDGKNEEEEEDVLGYYKSWNHIIGGDLSPFQLATGEYLLCKETFKPIRDPFFRANLDEESRVRFKTNEVSFKAFSQKSGGASHS